MKKTIVLNFKGLQSWGESSKKITRDTIEFPTLSGVVGILQSACGVYEENNDPLWEKITNIQMSILIVNPGLKQVDYQTAANAVKMDCSASKDTVVSYRYFLTDAHFLIAITANQNLIEIIAAGLKCPKNMLYMGRKAFPLNFDFFMGVHDGGNAEKILLNLLKNNGGKTNHTYYLVEESITNEVHSMILWDKPLRNKKFAPRKIIKRGVLCS